MTKNEFVLCSILFFKKFKGRNIEDVVQITDDWKPVKGKIEKLIFVNIGNFCGCVNDDRERACLFYDGDRNLRINGYWSSLIKNTDSFKTVEDFINHFKIPFKDIV